MIRVCCTVGTWQLITLVASLKQDAVDRQGRGEPATDFEDYLIVSEYGGVPDAFKNILHQMAEAVWPWRRIVWAYDLLTADRHFSQREFDRRRGLLLSKTGIGAGDPVEIWVCYINRPPEKLVFSTFTDASLILYEDGLTSYLPQTLSERLDPARQTTSGRRARFRAWQAVEKVQPVCRFRRGRWDVDPQHLARLSRAYYLLSETATPPALLANVPKFRVNYNLVRDALGVARRVLPPGDVSHKSDSQILILGQALSRNDIISRDEELGLYQQVVETILSRGYDVLWKEHPRIREPFFDDLKAGTGPHSVRVTQLTVPHAYPIELIAPQLSLAGCVAGTSAALFYLKRLYNLPCYTFASDLLPLLSDENRLMGEMVAAEALPLAQLPAISTLPVPKEAHV